MLDCDLSPADRTGFSLPQSPECGKNNGAVGEVEGRDSYFLRAVDQSVWPQGPSLPEYSPTIAVTQYPTIRVRVFSATGSGTYTTQAIERACEAHLLPFYGGHRRLVLTDKSDYTHALVLDCAMPDLKHLPQANVIGMAQVHPSLLCVTHEWVAYVQTHMLVYFIGTTTAENGCLPRPFVSHPGYTWYSLPTLPCGVAEKRSLMSIVVSLTSDKDGQGYGHKLVRRILKSDLPIDIHGTGCVLHTTNGDARLKGPFADANESVAFAPYLFTVVAERYAARRYHSTQVLTALIHCATPIYFGGPEAPARLPGMILALTGNLLEDMMLLRTICANPRPYVRNIDIPLVKKRSNLLYQLPAIFGAHTYLSPVSPSPTGSRSPVPGSAPFPPDIW